MKAKRERAMYAADGNDNGIALTMLSDFEDYDWCSEVNEEKSEDGSYVHVETEMKDEAVALTVLDKLEDLALRGIDERNEGSKIFIADTGASAHMSWTTEGMTNLRKCDDIVQDRFGIL